MVSTSFEAVKQVLNKQQRELIFVKDQTSKYLEANDNFLSYFGLHNNQQLRGKTDFDISIASFANKYIDADKTVLIHGELQIIEPMIRSNGKLEIMLTQKYPFFDSATQVHGVVGISRSITHKTAEMFIELFKNTDCNNFKISEKLFTEKVNAVIQKKLTDREQDILYYTLHGLSQKQVANKLDISVRTVEDHIDHIKDKLKCGQKYQLFEFAIHHGLMNIIPKHLWKE